MQPRCEALTASIADPIGGADVYYTWTGIGQNPKRMDSNERTFQRAMEDAYFENAVRMMAIQAVLKGRCVMRPRFIDDVEDFDDDTVLAMSMDTGEIPESPAGLVQEPIEGPTKYAGIIFDVIRPEYFMIYPSNELKITKAKTVGHQFTQRYEDIELKQEQGRYFPMSEIQVAQTSEALPNQPVPTVSWADDGPVICYDLIAKLIPPGKKKQKRYRITLAFDQMAVLDMEEYTYPEPWYFSPALRYPDDKFWPEQGIGERLVPLQTIYNDAWTLMMAGGAAGSFPSAIVTGWTGNQVTRIPFGSFLGVPQTPTNFYPLDSRFNADTASRIIEGVPAIADAVARVSQAGLGSNFAASTTATAVASIQAGQAAGITDYTGAVALELNRMAQFCRFLIVENWETFKAYQGDAIPTENVEDFRGRFKIELNGQAGPDSDTITMQKLTAWLGMMQQLGIQPAGQPQTTLNIDAVAQFITENMDFSLDTSKLINEPPEEDPNANPATGGGLQLLHAILLAAAASHEAGTQGLGPGADPGMPPQPGTPQLMPPGAPSNNVPQPGGNPGFTPAIVA